MSIENWGAVLITKLLEVTHGQGLYRNIQVHDQIFGILALQRKDETQHGIEIQQEVGEEGLLEEDQYLMKVNLEDLETTYLWRKARILAPDNQDHMVISSYTQGTTVNR